MYFRHFFSYSLSLQSLKVCLLYAAVLTLGISYPAQSQSVQSINIQRSLRLGDRGVDVLQLQQMLVQRGLLNLTIPRNAQTGFFGPATKAALQEFQSSEQGLRVDGVLNDETFRRLFAIGLTPSRTYSIALMQVQLSELGYYNGSIDGKFGPNTENALRDLRNETLMALDTRASGLDNTFEVVSSYYEQQRQQKEVLPHFDILEDRVEQSIPASILRGYGYLRRDEYLWRDEAFQEQRDYELVVPIDRADQTTLPTLERLIGLVEIVNGRFGRYVYVGSFVNRDDADRMMIYLHTKGFSTKVLH